MMSLRIESAYDKLDNIKELFNEYAAMLNLDLSFQDYEHELASLPRRYDMPNGRLYIALFDDKLAGCIGLRPLREDWCEMKRLFVRPQFRGKKVGRILVEKIIADAKSIGYKHMVLDTIPALENAVNLYKNIGFHETEPYCYNSVEGALFLRLDL